MGKNILFYLWRGEQEQIIEKSIFYFNEAKKRLLSQFDNIEEDARKFEADWLEERSKRFNPDFDDAGSIYEQAFSEGHYYYESLMEMQVQTHLSVAASLYHQWDKTLRNWLVKEIQHWTSSERVVSELWRVDIGKIIELMDALGWKFSSSDYAEVFDSFRLLINVYKHGNGLSFEQLKATYPEFIFDRFSELEQQVQAGQQPIPYSYLNYSHIRVNLEQLDSLSNAIISFWKSIPEYTYEQDVLNAPSWFVRALS